MPPCGGYRPAPSFPPLPPLNVWHSHSSFFLFPFYDFFFSSDNPSLRRTPVLKKLVCGVAYKKKKPCILEKKKKFVGVPYRHNLFIYLGGYSTPKPPRKKKKRRKVWNCAKMSYICLTKCRSYERPYF